MRAREEKGDLQVKEERKTRMRRTRKREQKENIADVLERREKGFVGEEGIGNGEGRSEQ